MDIIIYSPVSQWLKIHSLWAKLKKAGEASFSDVTQMSVSYDLSKKKLGQLSLELFFRETCAFWIVSTDTVSEVSQKQHKHFQSWYLA